MQAVPGFSIFWLSIMEEKTGSRGLPDKIIQEEEHRHGKNIDR